MEDNLRKFTRHPFSSAEKIDAFCHYSLEDELMPFHVANISKGGIGLIADKDIIKTITINDILILNHITGNSRLEFMKNLNIEVKWVLNSESMKNAGIGCEYTDISDSMIEQISAFISENSVGH